MMKRRKSLLLACLCLSFFLPHCARIEGGAKQERIYAELKKRDKPIVFFGVVKDNHGIQLADADIEVHYRHASRSYGGGVDKVHISTDGNGLFTVKDIAGTDLYINNISKYGYEFTFTDRRSFAYWDYLKEKEFHPSADSPVQFTIRKMNPPTLVFPGLVGKTFKDDSQKWFYDAEKAQFWTRQTSSNRPHLRDYSVTVKKTPGNNTWILTFQALRQGDGIFTSDSVLYSVPVSEMKSSASLTFPASGQRTELHLYLGCRSGVIYSGLDGEVAANQQELIMNLKSRTNKNSDPNIEYYEKVYAEYLQKQEQDKVRDRQEK